ncbi:MarR family transcriptional regulator [Embleya sp. MST-111070]|uniref:MarR family transcriptional regulator n=1 Tax=Embleya sp. MST-111070 TaxID=3398231 RepID=UPI003F73D353
MSDADASRPSWTFFTSHARVLSVIARDPEARVRDIAAVCLLTERAVQGILADLEAGGYLTRQRNGRRNTYRVVPGTEVRHPADRGRAVADALDLPVESFPGGSGTSAPSGGSGAPGSGVPGDRDSPGDHGGHGDREAPGRADEGPFEHEAH